MAQSGIELTIRDLEFEIGGKELDFVTTDDLAPLDEIVGQPRALRALELGLGINDSGYNIYLAGESGMGKKTLAERQLREQASQKPVPPDWVYVNNFEKPDMPMAISLVAGKGGRLKRSIAELVSHLQDELPKAFQQEDFSRQKQHLSSVYEQQGRELFDHLQKLAGEKGLMVQQGPEGRILLVPMRENRPMTPDEFELLSDKEKGDIDKQEEEVTIRVNDVLSRQGEFRKRMRLDIKNIERNFAARIIDPLIKEIEREFESEKLTTWLGMLRENMLDNIVKFQERQQPQPPQLAALLGGAPPAVEEEFLDYQVNVVIDNSRTTGAPVVIEQSPNYKNMYGTINGFFDRSGRMVTNYTYIQAGSILRANGGYLVFNLLEALLEPLVWKELKRTIKSGVLEYHMYDPFGVFATSALRPEPIPLKVKIVVMGNPLVYHLLHLYDEDFAEIFKVKADFSPEIDRSEISPILLARFVRKLRGTDSVLPFDPTAVSELFRAGVRMAGDTAKLSAEFSRLADLVREASFWAKKESASIVSRGHVLRAVEERVYRSNQIAEKIRELIRNGTLLVSVDGAVVGQVNGLSVTLLGDYMFGRPARLTASVGVGAAGIINIERESKLSGSTFDKAMLILEGYLRNKYAAKHALSLSASLAMEQSYGLIEGDSASVAELVCLLSALAQVPLRQDIAITGSVNQWGQVQAIGAASEKVEGFFDVCKELGLTGRQGVCLPSANVRNLVLRADVIEAVGKGSFHIWSIDSVDQALELLGGKPAGDLDEENTVHWLVEQRLRFTRKLGITFAASPEVLRTMTDG